MSLLTDTKPRTMAYKTQRYGITLSTGRQIGVAVFRRKGQAPVCTGFGVLNMTETELNEYALWLECIWKQIINSLTKAELVAVSKFDIDNDNT